MRRAASAATSAAWSITPPRDVLMRNALRLHERQLARADELGRVGRQRDMDRDVVRLAAAARAGSRSGTFGIVTAHARANASTVSPSACAFVASTRAMSPKPTIPSTCPASRWRGIARDSSIRRADVAVEGDEAARPAEQQREHMVGDFVPIRIAHVRDPDSALRRGGDVDVVDALAEMQRRPGIAASPPSCAP